MVAPTLESSVAWSREELTTDELLQIYLWTVIWHRSMPAFDGPNRRPEVVERVILGEVDEALEAREHEGTADFVPEDAQKEALDIVIPACAYAWRKKVKFDPDEIMLRLNGQGKRSNIYDLIAETAGNLSKEKSLLQKDLLRLLVLAYSMMLHLPKVDSPLVIANAKMRLNRDNYPEMYFGITHPLTGKILSLDEQEARYEHSVRCLRLIRNTVDPDHVGGLRWSDHAPYATLILDFRNAERNYQALQVAMAQLKKLPTAIRKGRQNDNNRVPNYF